VVIGQDRLVDVVQGNAKDLLVTLYFDHESGLLLREVRYANSPIGRVPTLTDYGDYRDVGGIKMPFRMTFAWFNGRDDIRLNEVRTNVPIGQEVFEKPAPAQTYKQQVISDYETIFASNTSDSKRSRSCIPDYGNSVHAGSGQRAVVLLERTAGCSRL
jgi:hypothetical protein